MKAIEMSSRSRDLRPAHYGMGLLALAVVLTSGCSGNSGTPSIGHVYKVEGAIQLTGGKPLNGGRVYFVSKDGSITSEGTIGADGRFNLKTGNEDGAPEGDYKVRVEPEDATLLSGANLGKRAAKGSKRLPFSLKYLDEDTSGLIAKVEPRANQIEPFLLK